MKPSTEAAPGPYRVERAESGNGWVCTGPTGTSLHATQGAAQLIARTSNAAHAAGRAEGEALAVALEALTGEPDMLVYPQRDVYGSCIKDDREAPLWTEAGLYGRVGKDAARTLLGRHERARAALARWRGR